MASRDGSSRAGPDLQHRVWVAILILATLVPATPIFHTYFVHEGSMGEVNMFLRLCSPPPRPRFLARRVAIFCFSRPYSILCPDSILLRCCSFRCGCVGHAPHLSARSQSPARTDRSRLRGDVEKVERQVLPKNRRSAVLAGHPRPCDSGPLATCPVAPGYFY